MIKLAICVQLLICSIANADPTNSPEYFYKKKALLKIEIVYTDTSGAQISTATRELGQGVYISPQGTILSAAHVIFPNKKTFQQINAHSYHLRVLEYHPKQEGKASYYSPNPVSYQSEYLVENSVTALSSKILLPCSNETTALCLGKSPPQALDFVLIATNSKTEKPFIGLGGPLDKPSKTKKLFGKLVEIAVLSDFNFDDSVSYQQVDIKENRTFEGTGNRPFVKGVSGSPLIIMETQKPGIFVIGVVNTASKTNNGGQFSFKFQTALIKQIEETILSRGKTKPHHYSSFGVKPASVGAYKYWDCYGPYPTFPNPNSLFGDYLASMLNITHEEFKGILSDTSAKRITDCGSKLGWVFTTEKVKHMYEQ